MGRVGPILAAVGSWRHTWLAKFRSQTADEVCGDMVDNDGDLRVDSCDPDGPGDCP